MLMKLTIGENPIEKDCPKNDKITSDFQNGNLLYYGFD